MNQVQSYNIYKTLSMIYISIYTEVWLVSGVMMLKNVFRALLFNDLFVARICRFFLEFLSNIMFIMFKCVLM